MKIAIGDYDPDTRSVPVTFEHLEVKHDRNVNACLDEDGGYDEVATAARVDEVARGVEVKIGVGAIVNRPPEPELSETDPVDEPTED